MLDTNTLLFFSVYINVLHKLETWNKHVNYFYVYTKRRHTRHDYWCLLCIDFEQITWLWLLAWRKDITKPSNYLKQNAAFTIHLFQIVVIFSRRPFSSILFQHSSLFSQKELIKPGLVWTRGRSGIYGGEDELCPWQMAHNRADKGPHSFGINSNSEM